MPNVFRIGRFNSKAPFYTGNEYVFNPNDIGSLVFWLDADDLPTITKDGSDRVSQWNDKSVNGINVTQGTAASKFLWVDGFLNGKAIMRTDGGDIMTSVFNSALDLRNNYTIFSVAKTTNIAAIFRILSTDGYAYGTSAPPGFAMHTHFTVKDYITSSAYWNATSFFINSLVLDSSNDAHFYRDGSLFETVTGIAPAIATTTGISIAARDAIPAENWTGDIAEVIIYNTALSNEDRASVEAYLNAKYSIF